MPISDILAQITGEPPSSVSTSNPTLKRKANVDLQHPSDKSLKKDHSINDLPKSAEYVPQTTSKVARALSSKFALEKPTLSRAKPSLPLGKTGSATPPPTESVKTPKKGSYAEILARGKAAQAVLGKVGKIQHKPVEKSLSKRERTEIKEREADLHRGHKKKSSDRKEIDARGAKNGIPETRGKISTKAAPPPEKKVKKAALATTGYAGTARPNPTAALKKLSVASPGNGKDRYGALASSNRYVSVSEEEEEEEEGDEEEEDYGSDASSDMEAAVFEVDEEEERAGLIARKEDEEAAREEARLKREKDEKRQKLMAMAKRRR